MLEKSYIQKNLFVQIKKFIIFFSNYILKIYREREPAVRSIQKYG